MQNIKERKGELDQTIREESPGIEADETTVTNDPFRQQVENNANQRQTEGAKKNEAEGELFVQGQSYRDRKQSTQADQVENSPESRKSAA